MLQYMLGICFDKTYTAMKNPDGGYDNKDNDGNEDKNNDNNVASESGPGGLIFDPIATPWSRLCLIEEDRATIMIYLRPRRHIHLRVGIYLLSKCPTNSIVNMCHKLLYAKIGVLDLCC